MARKLRALLWALVACCLLPGCMTVHETDFAPQNLEAPAPANQGATCPGCAGRGMVCGDCGGTGRCRACGGSGSVRLQANNTTVLCSSCGGRGDFGYVGGIRQICWTCSGSGVVSQEQWQQAQCIACTASGKCRPCQGSGAGNAICGRCKGSGRLFMGVCGFIGLSLKDASGGGALVAGVLPGSPADSVGMRQGDVIIKVGDSVVTGAEQAFTLIRLWFVGSEVPLTLRRGATDTLVKPKSVAYPSK